MDTFEKLRILADAAKYDNACTSCGSYRDSADGMIGRTMGGCLVHTYLADGRSISLLKVLMNNHCIYDCKYCVNRSSNDPPRAAFTPKELADLTVSFYERNYIEGLFLSSGVLKSPDYTMEMLLKTLLLIREEYHFHGYIHVKAIPNADQALLNAVGLAADRISVNIELPNSEGYKTIARQKNKKNIITPMHTIKNLIREYNADGFPKRFARSGQTTQMMVGTMRETDKTIITLSEALYRTFEMRRVYYSAFSPVQVCDCLPDERTPDWRARRLYQADMLIKQYQIGADEILPEDTDLDRDIDPKSAMALNNIGLFPVELNTADYETLIRIPGIGTASAAKIIKTRRERKITFEMLKPLGISLKRSVYFFTADGKYYGGKMLESPHLRGRLAADTARGQKNYEQICVW